MASSPQQCDNRHFVSLHKFESSIDRVMARMWAGVGDDRKTSLFPTIIGLDIDYNGRTAPLPILRGFLDKLKKLQEKHFVRFIVDTMWAVETNNGYVFYTHDGPKDDVCDVIWSVAVSGTNQVEVELRLSPNKHRRDLLQDISGCLKKFIKGVGENPSDNRIAELVINFYKHTKRLYQIPYLKEDLHILLLPKITGNGYYAVPLYGMRYFDGMRRWKNVSQQMDDRLHNYYEYFTQKDTPGESLYTVLGLIQENLSFGVTQSCIQETYGLAELVFAIWSYDNDCHKTNHDIILFHTSDKTRRETTVHSYPMHDLNYEN